MNIRNAQRQYRGWRLLCFAAILCATVLTRAQGHAAEVTQHGFEVATVKLNVRRDGSKMEFTPDGFTAMGVPLRQVIATAYGVYDAVRLVGLPLWAESDMWDIEAKFDPAVVSNYEDLSMQQRQQMLQALLAERFRLTIHHETRDMDGFGLVVAKGGVKMKQTPPDKVPQRDVKGYIGLITQSQRGLLEITGFSMQQFAQTLSSYAGQIVLDKTGLPGRYDISLRWTPEDFSATTMSAPDTGGPSIFSALQEQLGLKLQLGKFPMDTLVVDHVERPSEN